MKSVFAFACWFLFLTAQVYAGVALSTAAISDSPAVASDTETTDEPAVTAPALVSMEKARVAEPAYYKADGFIAPQDWSGDGVIVGDKEKKLMISDGETVFVSLGEGQVSPGTTCTIYRKLKKVKNPENGNKLGVEVRLIGTLEITTAVGKDSSTAKILNVREPAEVGDILAINNN